MTKTIEKRTGLAGQVQFYDTENKITLTGPSYGVGGAAIILSDGSQFLIDNPKRFGDKLNEEFAEKFFAGLFEQLDT